MPKIFFFTLTRNINKISKQKKYLWAAYKIKLLVRTCGNTRNSVINFIDKKELFIAYEMMITYIINKRLSNVQLTTKYLEILCHAHTVVSTIMV